MHSFFGKSGTFREIQRGMHREALRSSIVEKGDLRATRFVVNRPENPKSHSVLIEFGASRRVAKDPLKFVIARNHETLARAEVNGLKANHESLTNLNQ